MAQAHAAQLVHLLQVDLLENHPGRDKLLAELGATLQARLPQLQGTFQLSARHGQGVSHLRSSLLSRCASPASRLASAPSKVYLAALRMQQHKRHQHGRLPFTPGLHLTA